MKNSLKPESRVINETIIKKIWWTRHMSSLFVFLTCCDAKMVVRKTLNIHMLTNFSFQWMRAWLDVLKVNVGGFICVLCLSQRAVVSAPAELADPLSLLSALSHVSSPHTHTHRLASISLSSSENLVLMIFILLYFVVVSELKTKGCF